VSDETTITTTMEGDALIDAEGCILIPVADFPPGTVISITITVGGAEQATQVEAAPQKPRYMGQSRAINGGKA
jgi:hypothetical protein